MCALPIWTSPCPTISAIAIRTLVDPMSTTATALAPVRVEGIEDLGFVPVDIAKTFIAIEPDPTGHFQVGLLNPWMISCRWELSQCYCPWSGFCSGNLCSLTRMT